MAKAKSANDDLHETLLDILETQSNYGASRSDITLNASLVDDLMFNSLDIVEMVMEIEERFHVTIPEEIADRWKTVGDVEAWLRGQKAVCR